MRNGILKLPQPLGYLADLTEDVVFGERDLVRDRLDLAGQESTGDGAREKRHEADSHEYGDDGQARPPVVVIGMLDPNVVMVMIDQ